MRVVAGFAKGRLLKAPHGRKVRPTAGKVKSAFFDIIGNYIRNAHFLDLFSGVGSVGIEALSRGAKRAVFVEKNSNTVHLLHQNIWKDMRALAVVLPYDVSRALKILKKKKETFNIVYIDPPYDYAPVLEILKQLFQENLVESGGIVAVERSRRSQQAWLENTPFQPWQIKIYGDTALVLFRNGSFETLQGLN